MAYKRVNWENLPSTNTPVNADNLNKMDEVINSKQDKLTAGTGIEITGTNIINNLNANYSTKEQVIGKWIDGRNLYRKVIHFGVLPNSTTKMVNHNISNIDKITNIVAIATNGTQSQLIPYLSYSTLANGINLYTNKEVVAIGTGYNWSSYSAYITLEYTKTTN